MFIYDKKLQYPVKIDKPNPRLAAIIISQYGGPDGELGASLRYLSQRYSMPFDETTDTSYKPNQLSRNVDYALKRHSKVPDILYPNAFCRTETVIFSGV